jgi:hypothetical protein
MSQSDTSLSSYTLLSFIWLARAERRRISSGSTRHTHATRRPQPGPVRSLATHVTTLILSAGCWSPAAPPRGLHCSAVRLRSLASWLGRSGCCVRRLSRHQRRSLPLHWCRYVDSACSRGLTSQHFSASPSLAQPWQRGSLQRPAAVLRQPLLSCFSAVAHRARLPLALGSVRLAPQSLGR